MGSFFQGRLAGAVGFVSQFCLAALAHGGQAPTFARDVAPIVWTHCASCHRPGQSGPFSLLTYSDVHKRAAQIATVTGSRYMPPWLPSGPVGEFQDDRRLTEAEIKTISEWVKAGAPEGNPAEEPARPVFTEGWQLGPPDLVLKAARPFRVPASGPDVFWNFIFRTPLSGTRFVRAIEIRPGVRNVHHANVLIDRTGATNRLEKTAGEGFSGMDVTVDRNPFDPDSHFLFWKPRSAPYAEPDGMSWRLDPGNELVLNTHLQPSGKPEEVQPSIGLYFTDKPPAVFPILVELQDDEALDIPAGASAFAVSDEFQLPVDADLLAVYPHAHYLGKHLYAEVRFPDGSKRTLIDIPDWNLAWQGVFRYSKAVFLPRGSVVRMRFEYDNSADNVRNPHAPPQRVRAGNAASDEMGHLWLQLLPRGRGDHRRVIQEAMAEHRLTRDPDDFSACLNLGAIRLSRLDVQGAEAVLRKAVVLDGTRPEARDMLGMALQRLGRSADAEKEFAAAVAADPGYMDARYNLAKALAQRGRYSEALRQMKMVAAAFPAAAGIQQQLRELELRAAGR